MAGLNPFAYTPVLRSKKGEHDAMAVLSPSAVEMLRPQWVVPPRSQKDVEERRYLDADEYVVKNGRRIGKAWPRTSFVDARFLLNGLDASGEEKYLRTLFDSVRQDGGTPIPVIDLSNAGDESLKIYRDIIRDAGFSRAGLRLDADQMQDERLTDRLHRVLDLLAIGPVDSTIFLDFEDSSLIDDVDSAELVEDVFDRRLAGFAWGSVVFQSTSYPDVNPAPKNGIIKSGRPEFLLWRRLFDRGATTGRRPVFGDYAADNAAFKFDGGGRATPHIRLSVEDGWIISKGDHKAKWAVTMPQVAARITARPDFAGDGFSWGDAKLVDIASGDRPGNPTTWRTINTSHHLERTCRDIAARLGRQLPAYSNVRRGRQLSLLTDRE